jgi:hypothetical protein
VKSDSKTVPTVLKVASIFGCFYFESEIYMLHANYILLRRMNHVAFVLIVCLFYFLHLSNLNSLRNNS